jgi:hypothetical protein
VLAAVVFGGLGVTTASAYEVRQFCSPRYIGEYDVCLHGEKHSINWIDSDANHNSVCVNEYNGPGLTRYPYEWCATRGGYVYKAFDGSGWWQAGVHNRHSYSIYEYKARVGY